MADLTEKRWCDFVIEEIRSTDNVSPNFKVWELTKSETADRHSLDNNFKSNYHLQCAIYLTRLIAQPIRDEFGSFTPNSVYRCNELDRVLKGKPVGWVSLSQHTLGQAIDLEIPDISNMELARWIESHLEVDQLIIECHNKQKGPNSGWVHVSAVPPNRRMSLSYIYDPKQSTYVYVNGLKTSP